MTARPEYREGYTNGWLAAIKAASAQLEFEAQACVSDEYKEAIRHLAVVIACCLPPRHGDDA